MNLFRRQKRDEPVAIASDHAVAISAESDVRRTIHEGAERRARGRSAFSVLSIVPQVVGNEPLILAEVEAVTRNIAGELRSNDRFCRMPDGSYMVVLMESDDDHARVAAQRLSVNLTVRSTAVRRRKWLVGVAHYPHDAKTAAALIELARANALERDAA